MKKRLFAILLCVCMALSLLPMGALADADSVKVTFDVTPADATIQVMDKDNNPVEPTEEDSQVYTLPAGTFTYTISADTYITAKDTVVVGDTDQTITKVLEKKTATVTIVPLEDGGAIEVLRQDTNEAVKNNDTVPVGTTLTLNCNIPEGNGYHFNSWTSPKDGITNNVKVGATYTIGSDVTLVVISAEVAKDETPPADTEKFVDVPKDAYYHDAVYWAVDKGITEGTNATHFSPNGKCTRAQMVTFLWRDAGKPAPTGSENPFTDVKEDAYYYDAVLWAVEKGITVGTSKTAFSPDATVTRGQSMTFLWRCEGKPAPTTTDNPFTDVTESDYFYEPVLWAVGAGVTQGTSKTSFSPKQSCLRSQIVTFLYRAAGEK